MDQEKRTLDTSALEKTAKQCIDLILWRCEESVTGLLSVRKMRRHKALVASAMSATGAIRAFMAVEKAMK